jgi:hypothetical protein
MESNHRFLDVNQASSPLDHGIVQVAEVGVEPTKSRGSRPRRFASLRTRPSFSCRPRYRAGPTDRMKVSWAPAAPAMSDQGETRTPTPPRADVLSVVCLPVAPLGQSDPCGNRTRLASLRGSCPTDRRTGQSSRHTPLCRSRQTLDIDRPSSPAPSGPRLRHSGVCLLLFSAPGRS